MQCVDKKCVKREMTETKPDCDSRIHSLIYQMSSLELPSFQCANEIKFGETTTGAFLFPKLVHDHECHEKSQFQQDFLLFWDDLANSSYN